MFECGCEVGMLWMGLFYGVIGGEMFCLGLKIERDKGVDRFGWCFEDWEFRGMEIMVVLMEVDLEVV